MRTSVSMLVALFLGIQVEAGSITQTTTFHFALAGSRFTVYNQFDPSLGHLNEVATTVTLYGGTESFTLQNLSGTPVSFNATISAAVNTDAGSIFHGSSVLPLTLGQSQRTDIGPLFSVSSPGDQISDLKTTNLSPYIGTGTLGPGQLVAPPFFSNVSVDNSNIKVDSDHNSGFDGTETVTYYYGTSFATPEPSSLLMTTLGLTSVLAWNYRKVKGMFWK